MAFASYVEVLTTLAGFQYSRMVDVLGSLLLFVLSPAGWMPLAWRVALAINRFLLLSLPKALLRDFWAMQCFWSGMYSESLASLMPGASPSVSKLKATFFETIP